MFNGNELCSETFGAEQEANDMNTLLLELLNFKLFQRDETESFFLAVDIFHNLWRNIPRIVCKNWTLSNFRTTFLKIRVK